MCIICCPIIDVNCWHTFRLLSVAVYLYVNDSFYFVHRTTENRNIFTYEFLNHIHFLSMYDCTYMIINKVEFSLCLNNNNNNWTLIRSYRVQQKLKMTAYRANNDVVLMDREFHRNLLNVKHTAHTLYLLTWAISCGLKSNFTVMLRIVRMIVKIRRQKNDQPHMNVYYYISTQHIKMEFETEITFAKKIAHAIHWICIIASKKKKETKKKMAEERNEKRGERVEWI